MKWLELRVNRYFPVKKIKLSSRDKEESYFIRIEDASAKLDPEFVVRFKRMMAEIREEIKQYHISEEGLSEVESKEMAE